MKIVKDFLICVVILPSFLMGFIVLTVGGEAPLFPQREVYPTPSPPRLWKITLYSEDGKSIRQWETFDFYRTRRETTFTDLRTGEEIRASGNVIIERSK